ncbi:MAG: sigma-70 family RNA polymerase sigma factor [Fimbriimonadia bacterium]|nr:sigma-70 family RNA polymerase sigma factor [Fimbriimonadia bacterium]
MEIFYPHWRPYLHLGEADIIQLAQAGDDNATEIILYRYRNLVRKVIKPFFLAGADKDDLLQIGMIGLWEAITGYNPHRKACFATFARVCVRRHVMSAVKSAQRQHHAALNSSIPLQFMTEEELDLSDVLPDHRVDIENYIVQAEEHAEMERFIEQRLSSFEKQVLIDYREGKSYREIATQLHCSCKAIDNALVRIRKKVSRCRV